MEYALSDIIEKDTDLSIIRSFVENKNVRELFFSQIHKSGEVIKVFHSLTQKESDGHVGESDIVIICKNKKEKFAIFIEDKIAAEAQPMQRQRYDDRAKILMKTEGYSAYFIFLCAPKAYIESSKSDGYELFVTHEQIEKLLSNDSLEKAIFDFSTQRKKQTYTVNKDEYTTNFWEILTNEYIPTYFPSLLINKTTGPKGSRSFWPSFDTSIKGLKIIWKSNKNVIDLEFSGMAESNKYNELMSLLGSDNTTKYRLEKTGKSLSLRIYYSKSYAVSFREDFYSQIKNINVILNHVLEMYDVVNHLIKKNISKFPL